jgi:hypothetical protein
MKKYAILSIAGFFCLVGCQSAPAPADLSKLPPTPAMSFIDQMRQKYNGDAGKLTPEERKKMDEITRGHTNLAMKIPGK